MTNSLLSKIRALLNKTVENGCTEAEAYMAAKKAAEMMDQHGFQNADLEIKEAITKNTYFAPGRQLGDVGKVVVSIANYCDVKVWFARALKNSGGQTKIIFFGRESDVEVAKYLTGFLSSAFETEWRFYFSFIKNTDNHTMHGRAISASFISGMTKRVSFRLQQMKAERNKSYDVTSGKTGHDLVLVKNADVENAYKALQIKLRKGSSAQTRVSNTNALYAGIDAGNRINITSGISNKKVLAIA